MEGKELDTTFANQLRELGERLKTRLNTIAEIHEILLENGWKAFGGQYEITYYKDIPMEKAEQELKKLGVHEKLAKIEAQS